MNLDSCESCGKSLSGHRFRLFLCRDCMEKQKRDEINAKLGDIEELYTVHQRVKAIERWIFEQDGCRGLRYE